MRRESLLFSLASAMARALGDRRRRPLGDAFGRLFPVTLATSTASFFKESLLCLRGTAAGGVYVPVLTASAERESDDPAVLDSAVLAAFVGFGYFPA